MNDRRQLVNAASSRAAIECFRERKNKEASSRNRNSMCRQIDTRVTLCAQIDERLCKIETGQQGVSWVGRDRAEDGVDLAAGLLPPYQSYGTCYPPSAETSSRLRIINGSVGQSIGEDIDSLKQRHPVASI